MDVCIWGVLFVSLLSFLDSFFWWADLFANLRLQYLAFSILFLAAALGFPSRLMRWKAPAAAAVLLNLFPIALCLLPTASPLPPDSRPLMKVMVLNVRTQNRESTRVMDYIRKEDPDIVGLIELDQRWHDELREFSLAWPYQIGENRPDNFGIRLISRHPFAQKRLFRAPGSTIASLWVRMDPPRPFVCVVTHPLPPVNRLQAQLRDSQLDGVATLIHRETLPVLLLADLNATPWTHGYRRFVKASGLSGFISDRGIWPSRYDDVGFLGIPIDYVMAKGARLRKITIGPDVGSDHRGICAEVSIPFSPALD